MLIDEVTITVKAGDGGKGAVSFQRSEGNPKGGPDGGNGGNGGDVYFQGINDLTALSQFQYKKVWKADDGVAGKRKNLYGKNAEDFYVYVPEGTIVFDEAGKELFEVIDTKTHYLVVNGGKGGRGNNEFKSATNQTPQFAEPGGIGEEVVLRLELRLIAKVGLIGLPNAGKSSLLSVLTSAKPKIGNYAFTTLEPNVGMMGGVMIADIPGLIEGASTGKGLGVKFLKHIERTQLLVHCIDAIEPDPLAVYLTVRQEFEQYSRKLLDKPEIIVLTKNDQVSSQEVEKKMEALQKTHRQVVTTSILDDESITVLKDLLHARLTNTKQSKVV